jgi:hypothetical protein
VGWIFAQSTRERDFIMSAEEVCQMAAVQAELGERAVTAVVSMSVTEEGTPEIHFEAFQVGVPGALLSVAWSIKICTWLDNAFGTR